MTTERYTVWWLTGGVCFALAHKLNTCQGQGSNHRLKKPLNQMSYDEICELYAIPK
ncbi:MAG TPA: hypothetical protein PKM51_04375 [Chitinophagales bacterium]|nr:hypothetical protein [Chitinophagales bacterium]HNM31963.1 hypothetical protein [Chitinophagales bacterium]